MAYLENNHIENQIINQRKRRVIESSPRYTFKTDDFSSVFLFWELLRKKLFKNLSQNLKNVSY